MATTYTNGQVYWVNLKQDGHVQGGWHPGIIVQNNVGNYYSKTLNVVPITSKKKAKLPTHVFLAKGTCGLPRDSIAQCEGVRTICKSQVGEYIGTADPSIMKKIAKGCLINTPYLNFLEESDIDEIRDITELYK
jgi:mRNA interferase MazF